MLTLDLPRELAERLSAWAIREEKNLELLVIELLDRESHARGSRRGRADRWATGASVAGKAQPRLDSGRGVRHSLATCS